MPLALGSILLLITSLVLKQCTVEPVTLMAKVSVPTVPRMLRSLPSQHLRSLVICFLGSWKPWFFATVILSFLGAVVPWFPCQLKASGPCVHSSLDTRSWATCCLGSLVPWFFSCLVPTVLVFSHRPRPIHPCVGCYDKADAVHPPLFPCERCRLCELQRYRKAAVVRRSGT